MATKDDKEERQAEVNETLPHPFGTCVPLGFCNCEHPTQQTDTKDSKSK